MKQITDQEFETEVVKAKGLVLVDFFATWCGPCRQMLPLVTEVADEMAGKLTVVKMDVDEAPETPGRFNIQSIPTFILFKDGAVLSQKTGSMSKSELVSWIEQSL